MNSFFRLLGSRSVKRHRFTPGFYKRNGSQDLAARSNGSNYLQLDFFGSLI